MKSPFLTLWLGLALSGMAQELQYQPGEIRDTRSTAAFFSTLSVELKVSGPALKSAKAMRAVVERAVDSTGRNLLNAEKTKKDFEEVRPGSGHQTVAIKLSNPDRTATSLQELTGTLEVYVPGLDPESAVMIPGFQKGTNRPVDLPVLAAARVKVTVRTRGEIEALQAHRQGKSGPGGVAEKEGDQALENLFSLGLPGENDLSLTVEDPDERVIAIEFQDAAGRELEHAGRLSTSAHGLQTSTYAFNRKLPADARLAVYLATEQSLRKTPLLLKSIPLP